MNKKNYDNKKFLCYKVSGKNLIIEGFTTDEKRLLFLSSNQDFQPIDALVIGI